MQKKTLFYQRQILPAIGDFLSLKDLLNTASISKQYYQLLKQYLHEHYQLINQQQKNQFQQLKEIFNRKLYHYKKGDNFAKINNSKVLVGYVQSCENYSIVKTLDGEYKIIKTQAILNNQNIELMSFPKKYHLVSLSQTGIIYAAQGARLTRFKINQPEAFQNEQKISLQGQIQDIVCNYRFTVVVVREQEDSISLLLFDEKQTIEAYKRIQLPFEVNKFKTDGHLVMGRGTSYLLLNQTIYQVDVKTCTLTPLNDFVNKSIVKIMGGKSHYMAWERISRPSETWDTEEVITFAQKEGFDDYINVFKSEKVTGKILLEMDKKYMEEVLGIINHKLQQKLKLRLQEKNMQDVQGAIIYGWGRAVEGQLSTNPAKQISKPIKIKIPNDCKVIKLAGNFTFLENTKQNKVLVNFVDEKSNKLEWHEVTNRKVWNLSVVDNNIILVASAAKQKIPQRESERPVHQKKEKLRTAKNIIDKITWNQYMNSEEFRVGYLDKYDGILEIPFSELEQSEIKDYRIQYFKHNGKVVWDKKKRFDIL